MNNRDMRRIFIDAIEAFGVPYTITYDEGNMILAQVDFSDIFFGQNDVDDLQDWMAHEVGIPIYDLILEENRDGVQVGIDY